LQTNSICFEKEKSTRKQTRSALQRKVQLAIKQKAICKNKGQFEQKCSGVINIVFDKDK